MSSPLYISLVGMLWVRVVEAVLTRAMHCVCVGGVVGAGRIFRGDFLRNRPLLFFLNSCICRCLRVGDEVVVKVGGVVLGNCGGISVGGFLVVLVCVLLDAASGKVGGQSSKMSLGFASGPGAMCTWLSLPWRAIH